MTCLACPQPTAADDYGTNHELGDLLCLQHLLDAITGTLEPPADAEVRRARSVKARGCSGAKRTCPAAAVVHYVNASWCLAHRPPPEPRAPDNTAANATPDPPDHAMVAAVTAAQAIGTVLRTQPPYGTPLEGQ